MELDRFTIELRHKTEYSYGAYHAGFSLFDHVIVKNLTDENAQKLTLTVFASPNFLLTKSGAIDYITAGGCRFLSCDFLRPDVSFFASLAEPVSARLTLLLRDEAGKTLAVKEESVRLMPFDWFSGIGNMPETLAFFVTPAQKELEEIAAVCRSDALFPFAEKAYRYLKEKQITFSAENYAGNTTGRVRMAESVLRLGRANSLELCLFFASLLEKCGFAPMLFLSGKGNSYVAVSLKKEERPIAVSARFTTGELNDYLVIDGRYFGYGSDWDFDSAVYESRSSLGFSEEKILRVDIAACRRAHILPLPNRILENGKLYLTEETAEDTQGSFEEYLFLLERYQNSEKITSLLTGKPIYVQSEKKALPFMEELDVNQNKILHKILENDFSLIRAQHGSGVSKLFANAAALALPKGERVLVIRDELYNSDGFLNEASRLFDRAFLFDAENAEKKTLSAEDFPAFSASSEQSSADPEEALKKTLDQTDAYYGHLEGGKSIVSSFLLASEKYTKLREASDAVIFSPEQVGLLTDEMVQEWFSTVTEVVKALTEVGSVYRNPLHLIGQKEFSYEYKSRLIRQTEDFLHTLEALSAARDRLLPRFRSLGTLQDKTSLFAFIDLLRLLSESENVPSGFFQTPGEIDENFRKITKWIRANTENDAISRSVLLSFEPEVFELDAAELHCRWKTLESNKGLTALARRHAILKQVKRHLKPNFNVENIEYVLQSFDTYHANEQVIEEGKAEIVRLLNADFEKDASLEHLAAVSDLCYQVYALFSAHFPPESITDFIEEYKKVAASETAEELTALCAEAENLASRKKELEASLLGKLDVEYAFALSPEENYFDRIREALTEVLASLDNLRPWCEWLLVREKSMQIGLKNLISAVENGRVETEELKKSFLRAFFKAVCEYNFIEHPDLLPGKVSFEQAEEAFRAAIEQRNALALTERNAKISARRKEAIRALSDKVALPDLAVSDPMRLVSIFPCVVASLPVARKLFEKSDLEFDYILVENRRKIPLSDFLWLFCRAKHVSFCGDFSYAYAPLEKTLDLGASAFDHLWKITDEKYSLSAVYTGSPEIDAVRFLYANALRSELRSYSVPALTRENPVEWIPIHGFYHLDVPNANLQEANFVVDRIVEKAMSDDPDTMTVVAATQEQKNLILQLLAGKLRHQEELSRRLSAREKSVFITSCTQEIRSADEVVFSLTFAPDRSAPGARMPFEFQALAGFDTKKLINQLLAAAGKRLVFLSSVTKEELAYSPSLFSAGDAASLLMDLAKAPAALSACRRNGDIFPDSLVTRLEKALREKGYQTESGLQSGRYYVDLAVTDAEGRILLGILSDHSVLSQKANVSAIEFENAAYYRKNGWKIYRLRSADAFDSFEKVLDSILAILSQEA